MHKDTIDFIDFLEEHPELRPCQAIRAYYAFDYLLSWNVPAEFTIEKKYDVLDEFSAIGIEDTFYL